LEGVSRKPGQSGDDGDARIDAFPMHPTVRMASFPPSPIAEAYAGNSVTLPGQA